MEISSLLFAFGLLSAGIWLIFTINGEFKEKQRREQGFPAAPNRNPQLARAPSSTAPRRAALARTSESPTPAHPAKIPLAADERTTAADKWQSLDAAFVYESFERFTRE
jgi:hypothetical protein